MGDFPFCLLEVRAVSSHTMENKHSSSLIPDCLPMVDDKPCWIISCGRDLPIPQAFTSLRLQVPHMYVNIHKNIRKSHTYIRNLSKAKDV